MIVGRGMRGWRVVFGAVLIWGATGCSTGGSQTKENEMVGQPPSEQEDPFKVMRELERAEPASSSGVIGSGEGTSDRSSGTIAPEGKEDEPQRAEETKPSRAQRERAPRASEGHRCFSCVRICPTDAESCEKDASDVICGWGVHSDRKTARRAARAECRGALDLARQTDKWSRIEGDCPEPTCR
ncbi:MAG: hypothetical protein ABEL76_01970 [Bradymonadaceae bacterium]